MFGEWVVMSRRQYLALRLAQRKLPPFVEQSAVIPRQMMASISTDDIRMDGLDKPRVQLVVRIFFNAAEHFTRPHRSGRFFEAELMSDLSVFQQQSHLKGFLNEVLMAMYQAPDNFVGMTLRLQALHEAGQVINSMPKWHLHQTKIESSRMPGTKAENAFEPLRRDLMSRALFMIKKRPNPCDFCSGG
jgi:hypothetical protein